MLRLSVLRNLQVFSKNLPAFTNFNAVNCKTTDFNQKPHILNAPRQFSFTSIRYCEPHDENAEDVEASEKSEDIDEQALADEVNNGRKVHHMYKRLVGTPRDRTKVIPFEKSIEYLQSGSYKATYGDKKVWELYRRVHKGQLPKTLTRKTCIRSKVVVTGSPCPICRDEYLILDHRNLELLKQFISPFTGEIISFSRTGLCQRQHTKLEICIERAYDLGLLEFEVPFREFDYSEYFDVYQKSMFSTNREQLNL